MELRFHPEDAFVAHSIDASSITYQLLSSIIVPRPIAFITTVGTSGVVNAAPFSFFNAVSTEPPLISISIEWRGEARKDTSRNILESKEFVINVCSLDLAQAITQAAQEFPPDVSEIELTHLRLLPSQKVKPPRIANTLIQIECKLYKSLTIGNSCDLILGELVHLHIHKEILNPQGSIDITKLNPLGRLSGKAYAQITSYFENP